MRGALPAAIAAMLLAGAARLHGQDHAAASAHPGAGEGRPRDPHDCPGDCPGWRAGEDPEGQHHTNGATRESRSGGCRSDPSSGSKCGEARGARIGPAGVIASTNRGGWPGTALCGSLAASPAHGRRMAGFQNRHSREACLARHVLSSHPFTYDSFSATFPSRTRKTSTPRTYPGVPSRTHE